MDQRSLQSMRRDRKRLRAELSEIAAGKITHLDVGEKEQFVESIKHRIADLNAQIKRMEHA